MNELRHLLADYAEQARPYEVRKQALRQGQRRRRLRRTAPAAAFLAAAGTLGAIGLAYVVDGPLAAGPAASEPAASGPDVAPPRPAWPAPGAPPLPSLPATLVDAPDPAPLPSDHGVAPGLVLDYVDGVSLVTTRDGNQYRLDGHPRYFPFDLSPDGRWLTTNPYGTDQTSLRDLTGTLTVELTGAVAAWSPDGRWLLLGNPYTTTDVDQDRVPPNQGVVRLVDLTATPPAVTEVDLSACSQCQFVTVRANGDVVLARLGGAELGSLIVADRGTGALSPVDIDLSGPLSAEELAGTTAFAEEVAFAIGGTAYLASPDGTILIRVSAADGPTGDILVLDLDSAAALGRWHLPASDPAGRWSDPAGDRWLPSGMWAEGLPGVYAEGILLTHYEAQRPAAWELFDPTTGALITEVTDLRGLSTSA